MVGKDTHWPETALGWNLGRWQRTFQNVFDILLGKSPFQAQRENGSELWGDGEKVIFYIFLYKSASYILYFFLRILEII